jgi:hypothetical protein
MKDNAASLRCTKPLSIMDPFSALSIATAVIQVVDFSSKVISKSREIYLSADGTTEEVSLLQDATTNLEELLNDLGSTGIHEKSTGARRKGPDAQLIRLARESHMAATSLRTTLDRVKYNTDGKERRVFVQGLRSVMEHKNISTLTVRLDEIRKQVDTTLLVSLR